MVDATEMADRVLAELEEAWRENVPTLLNTVIDAVGDASELQLFQAALSQLVEAGHVKLQLEPLPRRDANLEVDFDPDSLSALVTYSQSRKCWTFVGDATPDVSLTESGKMRCHELLTERGYQWWRQSK